MKLPRDELAFREDYEDMVKQRALTTVFRPGNRIYPNWRGYKKGEIVSGRIIKQCGSDKDNIPPVFKEAKIPLRIAEIDIVPVAKLNPQDFKGSSADVTCPESLIQHLYRIYKKPLSEYDDMVTRIALEYL